jgi:type I restriction enzyme S subunit
MKIGWHTIEIGSIAPAKSNSMPDASAEVWNLSLDEVESVTGRILMKSHCRVSELGSAKCSFDTRHVLYSKLRPYLNKVVLPNEPGVGTSELIPMLPDQKRLDREFLAFYLRSPMFLDFANANTRGANLPRIAMKELWKHKVPVPDSLVEQRRIVARIKECMERVEEIEGLRSASQSEAKGFLRSFYHDLYENLITTRLTHPLGGVGRITGGGTPSKKRADFWVGNIPWVSPKEMKQRDIFKTSQSITLSAVEGSSVRLIEAPSVMFVVRGMILVHTLPVAVNRVPVTLNQDMKAITPNQGILVDYLATMVRGAERRLLGKIEVAGHGTRRLQAEHWSSLPIPILDIDEQHAVISKAQEVETAADTLLGDIALDEVSQLRDSILRKAFAREL